MNRPLPRNVRRALSALDQGNWLLAVNLLCSELEHNPTSAATAAHLARIYMQQGRYELAEELVDRAFLHANLGDPGSACPLTEPQRDLYLIKANLRLTHGDAPGALALYTLLLADKAHDPDLLFHTGLAYEKIAQHELAVAYLDRAIKADPAHMMAREIKGQILLCMGRLDDALTLYGGVATEQPDNVNAFVMLGRIHHHQARPVAAVAAWERAVALAPNADEPLRMLGRAALSAGDTGTARAYLTRAAMANPDNVLAHLDLADLLSGLGETRAALAHWDEAEGLCPQHPRLAQTRRQRERIARQLATCCIPPGGGSGARDYLLALTRAVSPCEHCLNLEPASP
ncbi:MAG: tetratricopeptide repeat protein [Nitrospirota bacterium]|nr:tetratricopeptide repeat protein [Nitrospirota bacterium]